MFYSYFAPATPSGLLKRTLSGLVIFHLLTPIQPCIPFRSLLFAKFGFFSSAGIVTLHFQRWTGKDLSRLYPQTTSDMDTLLSTDFVRL